jgi:hypothetical protein
MTYRVQLDPAFHPRAWGFLWDILLAGTSGPWRDKLDSTMRRLWRRFSRVPVHVARQVTTPVQPPTALAPPPHGLRASPSFGRIGSTPSLGGRRSFRPLVGTQPFGARGPTPYGAQPFSGRGPQTPSGGMGAGGGRGGG